MHALFALFSIFNTLKDMRLQPLRRSRFFYFPIPRYSISLLSPRSPLSVLLLIVCVGFLKALIIITFHHGGLGQEMQIQ